MIEIRNVTKEINNKVVLENINIKLKEGELVLLCGHNGCGKTMLLRLICGFINPTYGDRIEEREFKYGVIIENPTFFSQETAFQNLKYLATINKKIDNNEIETWLKRFNLLDYKDKKVKTFSLGMKQRLALCQAFMENPDVLLLDEPFNAIDEENLKIVCELIKKAKSERKLIVIASHSNINDLKFDKIIKMSNGTIKEIQENQKNLKKS